MTKKYHAVLFTDCSAMPIKPFGAHKVAHELRCHGFETLVVNQLASYTPQELQQIVDLCVSDQTLFVGISNTFLGYTTVRSDTSVTLRGNFFHAVLPQGPDTDKDFVSWVKAKNPQCKIVTGGTRSHCNYNNRLVDFVVIGYADISSVQLAQYLADQTPIAVKHYKNIYGVTVIEDALADHFDFNNSSMNWCNDDVVLQGETLPLEISRGCIFKCKFCNYRLNGKQALDYLKHASIIERELLHNYERYGTTNYRLLDDTFNDTEEKIDIMLDLVKRLPFQPEFSGYARLDLLTAKPHTIPKLFDMGFRTMFFGIETLNKRTGSIIGKGGDPDRMIDTLHQMKERYGDNVVLHGSFICGLPGESKQSVLDTMEKLISREIPLDLANFHALGITKKTVHVWESTFDLDYEKYGYTEDQTSIDQYGNAVHWKNEHMTFIEAVEIVKQFTAQYKANPAVFSKNLAAVQPSANYKTHLFSYLTNNVQS